MTNQQIKAAAEKFEALLREQLKRVDEINNAGDFLDYASLDTLIIGVVGGDGIGPAITHQARRVLEYLLKDEIASGKIEIRDIEGCTIENRAAKIRRCPTRCFQSSKSAT